MSEELPSNFWTFMKSRYPEFNGTSFSVTSSDGTVKSFNVSQCARDDYWNELIENYRNAFRCDKTIVLDIPFCIAYHNAMQKEKKEIFGWEISRAFPVPKNVEDFFKFRTVLELDKKAESLSSKLQISASQITEKNELIRLGQNYLREKLVPEVDQLRSNLAELKSNHSEADQRVKSLTTLLDSSCKVSSLFGRDLAVLQPDFFPLAEDCERRLRIYSDQIRALQELIAQKDRMVFDQSQAIKQIEANLRELYIKQRETESAIRDTRKDIFQELSKFGDDVLPHQLHKYVEESRLHLNKQKAAITLASHLKKVSARNFMGSRLKLAPKECSICSTSQPNYFMLGCGHGAYCAECIRRFVKVCPSCRKPITSVNPLDLFAKKLFLQ